MGLPNKQIKVQWVRHQAFKGTGAKSTTPSAPNYEKTGLAEFVPANQPTGLRLWNFPDGSAVIDANQQRALKSAFLSAITNSKNKYEIVGYRSGVGLDAVSSGLDVKRARAAREALIANGVPKNKFVRTFGKGSSQPLEKDMQGGKISAKGAARNRRVDILPTNDELVIPDEVVDGGQAVGEVKVSGDNGKSIRDKVPGGASETAEEVLTTADFVVDVVLGSMEMAMEGAVGTVIGSIVVILGPIIMMMEVVEAYEGLQKSALRKGFAQGLRLGSSNGHWLIHEGKSRVTASELQTNTRPGIEEFGNLYKNVPGVDLVAIQRSVFLGVEKSAEIVNVTMERAEKELRDVLKKKLNEKNAKAMYDANIGKVRDKVSERLAARIDAEVKAIRNER